MSNNGLESSSERQTSTDLASVSSQMDWDAVERTVSDTVDGMRAMEYVPSSGFKTLWPAMWCEWASIGIAELLEIRGFGRWTFVQARLADDPAGHAWLEYRDEDGLTIYSIDATLHQFSDHAVPFIGPGRTPAVARFTHVNFEGHWKDWHVIVHTPKFVEFAEATVRQMS